MDKKSLIISVVVVIAVIFCLGAFESMKPADDDDGVFYFRQFEDSRGEKITLTERPKKVAALSSDLAEIWTTVGGEVAIAAYESVEELISFKPDFVIYSVDSEAQCNVAEALEKKKITCAGMSVDSEEDYIETIMICALLLETQENTEKYIGELLGKVEAENKN